MSNEEMLSSFSFSVRKLASNVEVSFITSSVFDNFVGNLESTKEQNYNLNSKRIRWNCKCHQIVARCYTAQVGEN